MVSPPCEPGRAHETGCAQEIEPGQYVRHPQQPGWGLGQVQSAIGSRVTVTFEHAGKIVVNAAVVSLEVLDPRHICDVWP